jgi:hypothetical protein
MGRFRFDQGLYQGTGFSRAEEYRYEFREETRSRVSSRTV